MQVHRIDYESVGSISTISKIEIAKILHEFEVDIPESGRC